VGSLVTVTSVWEKIVGQNRAVDQLTHAVAQPVHAYLFLGPEGCGKEEAARVFSGALLSESDDPAHRTNDMASRGAHPDIHEIRREGASILVDQVDDVLTVASMTPSEGARKVIVMHEVDLMQPAAIVRMLKTLEEPPPGVHFVMLADQMVDSLVTIASRCVTIHFGPLESSVIVDTLVREGISADAAEEAARSAHGSMPRARLLANDRQLASRRDFFANIPRRIDGTGATVAAIVEQILGMIDESLEPLLLRHEQEIIDIEKTLVLMGVKRGGKKQLEDKHKREVRRHRTDELRAGLTEIAGVYRDELVRSTDQLRPDAYVTAITRIHEAMRKLTLNANEAILLRDLIWSLPSPSADAALQFVLAENTE
jgi:DNA polymerase-3 subunit delta'